MREWQSLTGCKCTKNTQLRNVAPQSFCDNWMFCRCTPEDAIWKAASYDRMCLRRWLYCGLRLAKQSFNTMGVGLWACCLTSLCVQNCPKCDVLMKRSGCLPCRTTAHGIHVACMHLFLQQDNMQPISWYWCDWDFQDHPLSAILHLLHQLHDLLQPQLGPYSIETHLDSYSIKHAYSIPQKQKKCAREEYELINNFWSKRVSKERRRQLPWSFVKFFCFAKTT